MRGPFGVRGPNHGPDSTGAPERRFRWSLPDVNHRRISSVLGRFIMTGGREDQLDAIDQELDNHENPTDELLGASDADHLDAFDTHEPPTAPPERS